MWAEHRTDNEPERLCLQAVTLRQEPSGLEKGVCIGIPDAWLKRRGNARKGPASIFSRGEWAAHPAAIQAAEVKTKMVSIPGAQQLPKVESPGDFLQENGENQAVKT